MQHGKSFLNAQFSGNYFQNPVDFLFFIMYYEVRIKVNIWQFPKRACPFPFSFLRKEKPWLSRLMP